MISFVHEGHIFNLKGTCFSSTGAHVQVWLRSPDYRPLQVKRRRTLKTTLKGLEEVGLLSFICGLMNVMLFFFESVLSVEC